MKDTKNIARTQRDTLFCKIFETSANKDDNLSCVDLVHRLHFRLDIRLRDVLSKTVLVAQFHGITWKHELFSCIPNHAKTRICVRTVRVAVDLRWKIIHIVGHDSH
jgi:hypothetical protein